MAKAKAKKKRGRGKRGKRRGGFWGWVARRSWPVRLVLRCGVFSAATGLVALLVVSVIYGFIASGFDLKELGRMPERSQVIDRNGVVLGRLHGENRTVVKLSEVSPFFIEAILAREDNRFYDHGGVDYVGVVRAAVRNLKEREVVQGASTITMQLARNSYGMFDKTLHRKVTEIYLAKWIEMKFSKDEILEGYMNRIFYGTGLYGIEMASQAYFGKAASELRLGESAMLAGIVRGPNRFSPFRNFEGALLERDAVLARMVKVGRLTAEEAGAAKAEVVEIAKAKVTMEVSYALDAVRRDLDIILDDQDVEDGGFKIYTTLDARLQAVAEASVERRLRDVEARSGYRHPTRAQFVNGGGVGVPGYLQGALVALDNETGGVVSVVGGRSFKESQYNRALLSKRQVGSTFKPFVYTAAFQAGLFPGTYLSDNPIARGELRTPQPGNWSPGNSDGKFMGMQAAEVGLVRSRNTMSVRAGDIAGIENVLELARRAGFPEVTSRSPQVFIGNLGATLKSVTSAYSIFANSGMRKRPYVIERIEDRNGGVMYQSGNIEYPVVTPGVSAMVGGLLEKVMAPGGTGARARSLGFKSRAGGKTGTTNDYHDAWFVGYTDRLTCGVWVGLDQPQRVIGRGYGSTLALPVWVDLMKHAEKIGYTLEAPRAEPVFTEVDLCRTSGLLATVGCGRAGGRYKAEIPYELMPGGYCGVHRGRPAAGKPGVPRAVPVGEKTLFEKIRGWFD